MGVVVVDENKNPYVIHNRLLEQEISSGEVDWSENAHIDYMLWLYATEEDGGAGFTDESYGIYSWHSHGSMQTFWSGTDEDFITRVGSTVPWMFSSVFNKKGDSKHRFDAYPDLSEKCPFMERTHIVWKEDSSVELIVIPSTETASEQIGEIENIATEYDELIKGLEEDRDKAIKEIRDVLVASQEELRKEVKEEMEADFKENVTVKSYNVHTTKGKGNVASPARFQDGKQSDKTNTGGGKGKGESGKDGVSDQIDTTGSERDIRDKTWIKCYDLEFFSFAHYSLREILKDKCAVPYEVIDDDVIRQLTDDEISTLASKPSKQDIIDIMKDMPDDEWEAAKWASSMSEYY